MKHEETKKKLLEDGEELAEFQRKYGLKGPIQLLFLQAFSAFDVFLADL